MRLKHQLHATLSIFPLIQVICCNFHLNPVPQNFSLFFRSNFARNFLTITYFVMLIIHLGKRLSENSRQERLLSFLDMVKMDSTVKMDIKDVKQAVEKHLKDLEINGPVRIASAKFLNGYWDAVVVYSRDIEVDDRKQKAGIIAVLLIDDETGKVESFRENPT